MVSSLVTALYIFKQVNRNDIYGKLKCRLTFTSQSVLLLCYCNYVKIKMYHIHYEQVFRCTETLVSRINIVSSPNINYYRLNTYMHGKCNTDMITDIAKHKVLNTL